MELPRGYNRRLQSAYPDLRMRWSNQQQCWLLERKANYARIDIDPSKYPDIEDTFIQHRDGYCQVGLYTPRGLPPVEPLISLLRRNDPNRMGLYGSNETQTDQLERVYKEQEEIAKRRKREADRDFNYEMADYLYRPYTENAFVQVPEKATGVPEHPQFGSRRTPIEG